MTVNNGHEFNERWNDDVGQMTVVAIRLWARTQDRITRAGLLESMVTRKSEFSSETTQDSTQSTHTHTPSPRTDIKIPVPPGIEPWYPGCEAEILSITYGVGHYIISSLYLLDFPF